TTGPVGGDGTNGVGGTGRYPNLSVSDPAYDAKDANATSAECATTNNRTYTNGGSLSCGLDDVSGGNRGRQQCPLKGSCTYDPLYGCGTITWNEFSAIDGANGQPGAGAGGGTYGIGAWAGDDMLQVYANAYGGYVCYIPPSDPDPDPDNTYGL